MAESEGEATHQNFLIPEAEIAEFKRANDVLVSLMTIEMGILQMLSQQQQIWCTTLSIAIVIYFSARLYPIHSRVWEQIILLLGGLAAILPLLIILPPFGCLSLLLWAISFIVFAKCNQETITKVEYRSILGTLISVLGIGNLVEYGGEADQTGDSLPQ